MTITAARVDGPGQPEADPGLPATDLVPDIDTVRALAERYSNWGRWGPDDELGTLNHIQASDVVAASNLVRTATSHWPSRSTRTGRSPAASGASTRST